MLDIDEVMTFLDSIPEETDVVLTGRYAPKQLIDRADFVNEVKDIKHLEETVTTEGIQY
jgi:cob(I)alamin adenosyltransferase